MPGKQTPQERLAYYMSKLFNEIGDTNYNSKRNIITLLKEHPQEIDLNTQFTNGLQQGNSLFFVICNIFPKLLPLVIDEATSLEKLAALDFRTKAVKGNYAGYSPFQLLTLSAISGLPEAKTALTILLNKIPFNQLAYQDLLGFNDTIDVGDQKGCTPFWFIALGAYNGLHKWLNITLEKFHRLNLFALSRATKESDNCSVYDILKNTQWKSNIDFLMAFQTARFLYEQLRSSNFQADPSLLQQQLEATEQLAFVAQNEGHLDVFCHLAMFYREIGDVENMKRAVNNISSHSPHYQEFHFHMANELRTNKQDFVNHYDPTPKSPATSATQRDDMLVEVVCHGLKSGEEAANSVRDAIFLYADPEQKRQPGVTIDGVIHGQPYDPAFDRIKGKTPEGHISGSPTTVRSILNAFRKNVSQAHEIEKLRQKIQKISQHCHEHGLELPKSPSSPKLT
ncbi:MAG: hypothetical protein BGO43_12935 [Gammaproteobacteria bacterium 39-13]|nr:hypothetical protein [Gammaproteobacteria bacterium]OJV90722.1 MAG: hypothetical protein BGO43_12935 [Gammaproteobacteria bacterium 39-13]